MSSAGAHIKQNAMTLAILLFVAGVTGNVCAQSAYDAPARIALADEINHTYGQTVEPSLSITELFDIKNRLEMTVSIAHKYSVELDYREHSFIELCDIGDRIQLTASINRNYGKNIDWRTYGYNQLLEIDSQLKSQIEPQSHSPKPSNQTSGQNTPHTSEAGLTEGSIDLRRQY